MKLKASEMKTLQTIDEPLNAVELIRQRAAYEIYGDEDLYICNISDVVDKYRVWRQHMPRVRPFYAVKCNNSPAVLGTLAALGTGFDCASKVEIQEAMSHGVNADSIIFANPTKATAHLRYAAEMNVRKMTVDGESELHKIHKFFPTAELVLRIKCDAKSATRRFGDKYGCDPELEAPELIRLARSLGLNMIGISFHVGARCQDIPAYAKAIQAARELFDYAKTVGFEFNLLDIGGGFQGDKGTSIKEAASVINESLNLHFPTSEVDVIAEPGRYFVASAYTLACRVHSKRDIRHDGKFINAMYFLNDGVYGSLNAHDLKVFQPLTLKSPNEDKFPSSLWGPTCDSLDCILKSVMLPRLNLGDYVIFENMGAYTITVACQFNGFQMPKVEYYIERRHLGDINAANYEYLLETY